MESVYALGVLDTPTHVMVWAFDNAQAYLDAIQLCHAWNRPFVAYHKAVRDSAGNPHPVPNTAWNLTPQGWLEMSQGFNDLHELKNYLEESS